jgi:serine/threonine-protein kinase
MGIVWEAVDTASGEGVALKFLHGLAERRPELRLRFLREARAMMAVNHPNVLRTREVVITDDGAPMLVMDLLIGESLSARLARVRTLPVSEFSDIFLPVLSAVGHAHAAGIVHRDLKPDNIFVLQDAAPGERVRVLDFGLAKWLRVASTTSPTSETVTGALTETGAILGTPQYMSPEQVFGEKELDHRTDIWSLGIIMYECLAGVRPVTGSNVGQMFKAITSGAIIPLAKAAPSVPLQLAELNRRMLSVNVSARPTDLREVQSIFRLYATTTTTAPDIKPAIPLVPNEPAQAAPTDGPTSHEPAQPKARARWHLPALVGTAALAVVGGRFLWTERAHDETVASRSVASQPSAEPSPSVPELQPGSASSTLGVERPEDTASIPAHDASMAGDRLLLTQDGDSGVRVGGAFGAGPYPRATPARSGEGATDVHPMDGGGVAIRSRAAKEAPAVPAPSIASTPSAATAPAVTPPAPSLIKQW